MQYHLVIEKCISLKTPSCCSIETVRGKGGEREERGDREEREGSISGCQEGQGRKSSSVRTIFRKHGFRLGKGEYGG